MQTLPPTRRPDAASCATAENFAPHILITAPSNVAVDNIVGRILEEGFLDGEVAFFFFFNVVVAFPPGWWFSFSLSMWVFSVSRHVLWKEAVFSVVVTRRYRVSRRRTAGEV